MHVSKKVFTKLSATYLAADVLHLSVAPLLLFIGNFEKVLTNSTLYPFLETLEKCTHLSVGPLLPFLGNVEKVLTDSKDLYLKSFFF